MQGWRISMEDAHAAVLDLQVEDGGKDFKAASQEDRLSFFGVYDGHGGDKVAIFAGENIHKIVAKQEAFKKGELEQALKDGFLATDRAILNGGIHGHASTCNAHLTMCCRPQVRRGSVWMYCISGHHIKDAHIRGMLAPCLHADIRLLMCFRPTPAIRGLCLV